MRVAHRRRRGVVAVATLATLVGSAGLAYAGLAPGSHPDDLADKGGARRLSGDQTTAVARAVKGGHAKNVILLIGDGMGDSEITVARNYAEGAAGRFKGIDALPLTGQYTTYSLDKATGKPDYVPDSAATGTAWATGTKTYDNAISVDLDDQDQPTLLELAKLNGLRTGDVSTAEIQDATPAVEVAHVSQRKCYGPTTTLASCPDDALENGGPGSITEQLLDVRPDVTLGGGAATFGETPAVGDYAGMTLLEQATERGYQVVDDADGLDAVDEADQDAPLLGLFSEGNMEVRYTGPAATVGGAKLPPEECTPNPARPDTQPTLADMTSKAIDLLDNPDGFFLQVEGASIDKQDHAANACGQIGETVDLDEAVQVALAFAEKQGNTSVFVTADHAHSSQIIEVGSTSPGLSVALTTADGAPMAVNYGTSPQGGSQQHTGSQLRVAGYGPQAANVVGLTDQTDLFFTISRALGLVEDPAAASARGKVVARPGSVRVHRKVALAVRRFGGDRSATVVVRGGGRKVTRSVALSGGSATLGYRPGRPGRYAVVVKGAQTGVRSATHFTARRPHHR